MWAEGKSFCQGRVVEAIASALSEAGLSDKAAGEGLLKRSVGSSLRLRKGAAPERSRWSERGLAVRVVIEDGRSSLVSTSRWEAPEVVASEAVRQALATSHHAEVTASPADSQPFDGDHGGYLEGDMHAPSGNQLEAALHELERAARETDQRVIALDRATLRGAIVDSILVTTKGAVSCVRQPFAHAQASVLAREGLRVSSASDSWAGASLEGLAGLGQRLGRNVLLQLLGVQTHPPVSRMLLSSGAAAELSFVMAPLLLGLAGKVGAADCETLTLHPGLSFSEDAVRDGLARSAPLDGAGCPLRELRVIESGRLTVPDKADLPFVRASLADFPVRGWNRLSWRFAAGASSFDELLASLGTGLLIEDLRPLSVSMESRTFVGLAAGRWVEKGRLRHSLSGLRFEIELFDFLTRITAGGGEPLSCHSSGTVRAVPLLLADSESLARP